MSIPKIKSIIVGDQIADISENHQVSGVREKQSAYL